MKRLGTIFENKTKMYMSMVMCRFCYVCFSKDRVLGNNPMSVVYSSYWKNKLGING